MNEQACPELHTLALLAADQLGAEAAVVRAHLAACESCREKSATLAQLLDFPATQEPPPAVLPALLERIGEALASQAQKTPTTPRKRTKSPMRTTAKPTKTPSDAKTRTASGSKKTSSGSKKTPSGSKKTPSGSRGRVAVAVPATGLLRWTAVAASAIVAVGVGTAFVIVGSGPRDPAQVAVNDAAPVVQPERGPAGSVQPKSPDDTTSETSPPDVSSLSPAEQRERERLQELAGEVVGLAHGDEFMRAKALKMISVLEQSANGKNMDIVRHTKRRVQELLSVPQRPAMPEADAQKHAAEEAARKKAEDEARQRAEEELARRNTVAPSAPEPAPTNPSLLAYRELSKKLGPALAGFDFDKAKGLLADADSLGLEGQAAKDLADDRAAVPLLQKLLDYAGSPKAWKSVLELEDQTWRLAKGDHVTGTLKKVENNTLTIFMKVGGLADYKISELVLKDVCVYARLGCPKDERGVCFAGWGLALYYASDLDGAQAKLEESLKEPGALETLARSFVGRIVRERIAHETPPTELAMNPPKPDTRPPVPTSDPGEPDVHPEPPAASPEVIAALKEGLHGATVSAEAGGKVGVTYSCTQDSMKEDFAVAGNGTIGQNDAYAHWGLYFGVSKNDAAQLAHACTWKGDFDWTIEYMLNTSINSSSALFFNVDLTENAKKPRGLKALFGQELYKYDPKMSKPVGGAVDLTAFGAERRYTVRLVRKGDEFTLYFNGGKRATTKMAGADARFVFETAGVPIWLTRLEMHGTPTIKAPAKK